MFAVPPKVIYASRVLTPHEELTDRVMLIEDGKITAMGHRDEIIVPGRTTLWRGA